MIVVSTHAAECCIHVARFAAPRGLRAGIASVHGANERAAKVVTLAKSQQRKLRLHVHPDRLTAARKEALGEDLPSKIAAVNCVIDAALLTVGDGKAAVAYLDSLPPDPRTSTAGCAPGAVEGVVVVGFPLGTNR